MKNEVLEKTKTPYDFLSHLPVSLIEKNDLLDPLLPRVEWELEVLRDVVRLGPDIVPELISKLSMHGRSWCTWNSYDLQETFCIREN